MVYYSFACFQLPLTFKRQEHPHYNINLIFPNEKAVHQNIKILRNTFVFCYKENTIF